MIASSEPQMQGNECSEAIAFTVYQVIDPSMIFLQNDIPEIIINTSTLTKMRGGLL